MNRILLSVILPLVAMEGVRRMWFGCYHGLLRRRMRRSDFNLEPEGSISGWRALIIGIGMLLIGGFLAVSALLILFDQWR